MPLARPGESRAGMLQRHSPFFAVRLRPALLPFAARLIAATAPSAAAQIRTLIEDLALRSLERHAALAHEAIDTGFVQAGLIDAYKTRRGRRGQSTNRGTPGRECSDPCRPARTRAGADRGLRGWHLPHTRRPLRPAVVRTRSSRGSSAARARFRFGTTVQQIAEARCGVRIDATGESTTAGAVVIAAGAWSRRLTGAGGRLYPAKEAGKGYSLDLETGPEHLLRHPVTLREARIALTPLRGRTRLAGTMAFQGLDAAIDRSRVNAITVGVVEESLPGARQASVLTTWAGLRPCTPDGLPCVGWLPRHQRVAVAAGHAMLGLTLAPITGHLVGELLDGRKSAELTAEVPPASSGARALRPAGSGCDRWTHERFASSCGARLLELRRQNLGVMSNHCRRTFPADRQGQRPRPIEPTHRVWPGGGRPTA